MATLRDIPEETANRMMMVHGSGKLLRAITGEPEPVPPPRLPRPPAPRTYVRVSDRAPRAIPKAVHDLLGAVADAFEVHPDELIGPSKSRELVLARAVAIRLIRERTWETGEPKHSFPTIGRYLRRDHSSICHSLAHFPEYAEKFPEIEEVYQALRERGE